MALWIHGMSLPKAKTPPMKNVPPHEREALLKVAIQGGTTAVAGRRVLLASDLSAAV